MNCPELLRILFCFEVDTTISGTTVPYGTIRDGWTPFNADISLSENAHLTLFRRANTSAIGSNSGCLCAIEREQLTPEFRGKVVYPGCT